MQSFSMESVSAAVRYLVADSSRIQYFVSDASFKAMLILDTKSGVLCACSASATFAPILVPLLKSCLDKQSLSLLRSNVCKDLQFLLQTQKTFLQSCSPFSNSLIFNFPFSTFNYFITYPRLCQELFFHSYLLFFVFFIPAPHFCVTVAYFSVFSVKIIKNGGEKLWR